MMRKINKFFFTVACLLAGFVLFSQSCPTCPPPHECCEGILPEGYNGSSSSSDPTIQALIDEYNACELNPEAYCTIPIDNSRYIYISIVAGVALASFVIARRMKT